MTGPAELRQPAGHLRPGHHRHGAGATEPPLAPASSFTINVIENPTRSLVVTPIVSSRSRRGAVALGGMFIAASAVLVSTPAASAAPSSDAVNAINDRYSAFGGAGLCAGQNA